MKKLFSLILAVIMLMSMAACSNEPAEPSEPEEPASSEEEIIEEPTEPEFSGAEVTYKLQNFE